ncbi:MAG: DNA polymerase I [Opitutales bacterium]|nr:DNA polymerase I [Opitutales bacterium]
MKLMVLDGNSIVNRAFYGVRLLTTRDGIPTNAVYGFLTILSKLLDESKPDALCVCFDVHAPTFRHEKYADYKAGRRPMPDELRPQIPLLKEVLAAMRVPAYELAGWEADDLLGTIGVHCEAAGWDCEIVTGDRDSLQLVTERVHVKLVVSRMGKTETKEFSPASFFEAYGFVPAQIVDLKALMGDSSDNIKGVAGIGEKTATELIKKFGPISSVYENLDTIDVSASVRKKLEAGRESAFESYDLATIRTDAPIAFSPEKNLRVEPDVPALYTLFKKLEFSKLIAKWNLAPADGGNDDLPLFASGESAAEKSDGVPALAEISSLSEFLTHCEKQERVYVFSDTKSENPLASLAVVAGTRVAEISSEKFPPADFRAFSEKFFGGSVKKVAHDVKALMRACLAAGLPSDGFVFDTALAAYLLEPTRAVAPLPEDVPATARALLVKEFCEAQIPALDAAGLAKLYREIEFPLCAVLAEAEHVGIAVDREKLEAFSRETDTRAQAAQSEVFSLAGTEFNLNSPKQLGEVLFEKLGLPAKKKTKTGYSTNADVLKELEPLHPVVGKIGEFRQFSKLKTIADGLIDAIAADGRIHTTFNMTITATGRLSSSDPNLQNVPTRGELGNEMRKMFVAERGNVLVDADYSQIELRVLAHISGDAAMQKAFRDGEDIHTVTACQIFRAVPVQITPLMRRHAKAVNFGIVYGIGEFSLAQDLGVARRDAKRYIENYLEKYSGVRDYMKNVVEKAKSDGFVSTLLGRRRAMPELASSNHNVRAFGERVALNAPIQGTAADIIKIAMLRVHKRLKKDVPAAKIVLQIHDELLVEVPEAEAETVKKLLSEEMSAAFPLAVPLVADSASGKSWADAK